MKIEFDYSGRTAVITGGASGFGRAVAELLAKGGASVALWDRDLEPARGVAAELTTAPKAEAFAVDVADNASVEAAFKATEAAFGQVDILINSAGVAGPIAKLWDHTPEQWAQVIDINLNGTYNTCRAVVPGMMERNYGRIANIASIAGKEGNPNASAYSASKAGVIGLTKSLGKELAGHDISVNAITPAAARTAILETITEEHIEFMLSKIPRGRLVLVEEVASMIGYMVSEDCAYTTGFTFDISGGRATY